MESQNLEVKNLVGQHPEFNILGDFINLVSQKPELKILAKFKILVSQNPEFKILDSQIAEFNILADFEILASQYPWLRTNYAKDWAKFEIVQQNLPLYFVCS